MDALREALRNKRGSIAAKDQESFTKAKKGPEGREFGLGGNGPANEDFKEDLSNEDNSDLAPVTKSEHQKDDSAQGGSEGHPHEEQSSYDEKLGDRTHNEKAEVQEDKLESEDRGPRDDRGENDKDGVNIRKGKFPGQEEEMENANRQSEMKDMFGPDFNASEHAMSSHRPRSLGERARMEAAKKYREKERY